MPMVHGDRFILCSDGLVDEVHDDDIADFAVSIRDPQLCAERLIAKANASGGRDNITVVVVDVLQGVEPTAAAADIESEPGWPDSESTSTMIDADANSVPAVGIIAAHGTPVPPVVVVGGPGEPAAASSGWGTRRYLKWLGAAMSGSSPLIAALVYNNVRRFASVTTVWVTSRRRRPHTAQVNTSTTATSTTVAPATTTIVLSTPYEHVADAASRRRTGSDWS